MNKSIIYFPLIESIYGLYFSFLNQKRKINSFMTRNLTYLDYDDETLPENEEDTCPLHHVSRRRKINTYKYDNVRKIHIIYIIADIVLIIISFFIFLWNVDNIGLLIIAFPLVIFAINFFNATVITKEVEEGMFLGNFISFGFLIAIIIINWSKIEDKGKYFTILFISLIFIMLSLVDIWVGPENVPVTKHLRSIFQTSALALLVYALYIYYVDITNMPSNSTD